MELKNYNEIIADEDISSCVIKFWKYDNTQGEDKQILILPDGNFELIIKIWNNGCLIEVFGLTTKQLSLVSPEKTLVLGITFKPIASEYILKQYLSDILNSKRILDNNFWGINSVPFGDFENWVNQISEKIRNELKTCKNLDLRKFKTFDLLNKTKGTIPIQTLSEEVFWSSRQLNRYFKNRFGLSLKLYSNVLRSHAMFKQIIEGDLSPNDSFYDQSHFIKEIKKHSGFSPTKLKKNDRFIQFNV